MRFQFVSVVVLLASLSGSSWCCAEDPLFEDTFDKGLSDKWKAVGLKSEDYRIRDGALEIRLQPNKQDGGTPMLKVDLPFKTSDTLTASVDVTVVGPPLPRGAWAGLALTGQKGERFTVRKTNLDGYFVFAPGEVGFIGKKGEEGDPGKYTVKYWPADKSAGPLRIIVRGDYAYFQVGPSSTDEYKTLFHTAISKSDSGMGFGLMAVGGVSDVEQWVRFDNFRVQK